MAEAVVIGNILKRGWEFYDQVRHRLDASDFTREHHQTFWRTAEKLADENTEPNLGAMMCALSPAGWPGGTSMDALMQIHADCPLAVDAEFFVRQIKRAGRERSAIALASKISTLTELGYEDHIEDIREAQQQLAKLEEPDEPIGGTLSRSITAAGGINAILAPPQGQIPTPWPWLTRTLNGGIARGELWLLAARPSIGKSTFALQWALFCACRGIRVSLASLEMPSRAIMQRLIAQAAHVPFSDIRRGQLTSVQINRIGSTLPEIEEIPLTINDQAYQLRQILAMCTGENKPDLLIVDYLGLIETKKKHENRTQEVSYISRQLKKATQSTGVPILALCQLNRGNEHEARRPILADLRDAGSLEQDADGVLMLHSAAKLKGKRVDAPLDETELIVAKQRNGERDKGCALKADLMFCQFWEWDQLREVAS
jgi:replicative DNA helicase